MKKILAVCSLLLILSLCACGAAAPDRTAPSATVNTEYLDKAVSYINTLIDAENFTFTSDTGKLTGEWTAENVAFTDLPDEITLDGETLSLGRDGIEALEGFQISVNTPVTVAPHQSAEVSVEHNGQVCTLYTQVNDSSDPAPVEELMFTGFYVTGDAFSPFDYNGITDRSTLEDVIQSDLPVSSINAAVHGTETLVYVTYIRDMSDHMPQDRPGATVTVGAEYNGETSRVISVRFSADQ